MKQTNPSTSLRMLGSRNTWTRDGFCEDEWDNGYEFKGKNIKCAPLDVFSEINKINFRKRDFKFIWSRTIKRLKKLYGVKSLFQLGIAVESRDFI